MRWRGLPRRRPALPAALAEALGVGDERVLAWSELAGGGAAAATLEGVRILTPQGRQVRRPWVDVDHAAWDQDSQTLAIWWVGSRQSTPLEIESGSFLPEVVHERVRASVVSTRDVAVPGGKPVWVALRKACDGSLTTQAVAPVGVRLSDPEVSRRVARAQAELREDAGLAPPIPPVAPLLPPVAPPVTPVAPSIAPVATSGPEEAPGVHRTASEL